ncbi:extracellular solute-binding protein [Austwickia chelonae]|uniref:extracellular solute-binding protein n=1 Tax=Austwickia chelonae TaxID=100225 RepID=UPI000E27A862|nr:extracellular solute-binding protein [Austwickia chelonae]
MRRSILVTAMLTTTLIAVTACGGGNSGSGGSGSSAKAGDIKGELTWWDTSDATNEGPAYKELIDEFQKKYPNVKINYQSVPFAEAQNKFKTAAAAKSGAPDIFRSDVAWVPELASLGYLYKLNGTALDKDTGDFLEAARGSTQWNNGTYGVPQVTDTLALFYNKKLLQEAGVEAPKTWEEMKTAAATVKTKTGKDGAYLNPVGYYTLPFIYGEGGDLLDTSAKKITANSTESVAGVAKMQELMGSPGFVKPPASEAYKAMTDAFNGGTVGMIVQGPWEIAGIKKADTFGGIDNLGIAPVPAGSKQAAGPIGGHDYVVWSGMSEDKAKAAIAFVEFMTSTETQAKIADKIGVLPTRKSAYTKVTNPVVKQFQPAMDAARARAWIPEAGQLFTPMDKTITSVVVNSADPKTAMTELAQKYKAEIVKDYAAE